MVQRATSKLTDQAGTQMAIDFSLDDGIAVITINRPEVDPMTFGVK